MKKVALVTGAAKGIGAAVVKKLCEDGFSVAINYNTSEQRALSLCSFCESQGYEVLPVKCDISSSHAADKMFSEIEEKLGSVSVLVNNAGISLWGLFDMTTDEEYEKIIASNLTGTFNCTRRAIPSMLKEKHGRIINISSVWGQTGASCEVLYSMTKAGLIGLTKALSREYAPSGITVNCIAPGVIDTDMMNRFSDEEKSGICEEIPTGTMGTPEDVANAVSFFADNRSSYITGQILGVNGGMV